jgi:tetratricopeptide (TPR) repeat protein
MDNDELLYRYETLGEESDFLAAKPLFEQDIRERERRGQPDALLLRQYGYLLECHGRRTIRRAIEQYERSIAVDPDDIKAQLQWIGAKASLAEEHDAITMYRGRVAAAPTDLRELRLLAAAYLSAKDFAAAAEVIDTGLRLAPTDWALLSDRGVVKAGTGDPEGALADWRRAYEIDPENLSPVFSSADLLEREGRLAEAAEAWRYIVDYCQAHGWEWDAVWPREMLERLLGLIAQHPDPGSEPAT